MEHSSDGWRKALSRLPLCGSSSGSSELVEGALARFRTPPRGGDGARFGFLCFGANRRLRKRWNSKRGCEGSDAIAAIDEGYSSKGGALRGRLWRAGCGFGRAWVERA